MRKRISEWSGLVLLAASLPLAAQTSAASKASTGNSGKSWNTGSKTPWGDPDLQGTWTSDDTWGVPMERPTQYGDRLYLTEDELKDREKRVEQSKERIENPSDTNHSPAKAQLDAEENGTPPPAPAAGGGRGGRGGRGPSVDAAPVPGQFGEYARRASKQTSQVVDPPNGRIPALTPEGLKKRTAAAALRGKTPETWTDWSIYDRCITRGVAGSIIPVIYGNGLEIVQAPGYVAIRYEMVHDARIIPTDGRPHLPNTVHTYMGDPVGHWEGNTLVVETTNFNDKMGIGPNGGGFESEDMKLTERFTRVAENTINYELTIDDPKTYTAAWKVAFPITHEPGYQIYEYACHEGNMAMRNMITGTLAQEAAAAAKKN
ncbi:MAG TPA: hypothetical protein VHY84_07085 [Bryobacteraceae bacterium]|jgi:hypothetical protein|nr:hypothetical protein [Bryobacteraceae bacterium]